MLKLTTKKYKLKTLHFIQQGHLANKKGFDTAKKLMADKNSDVRWQALIALSNYLRIYPEQIWKIIERYGCSSNADMRAGVATVLLEHLLDYRFKVYFSKCKRLVQSSKGVFLETMRYCWLLDKRNENVLKKYIAR